MDITKTVFNTNAIFRRLPDGMSNRHEMYLFAKGGMSALDKKQLKLIESIIDMDYKRVKAFIVEAKKQAI